jgi:hypothetical protein
MPSACSNRVSSRASGRASLRALGIGLALALVGVIAVVTLSSGDGGVAGVGALAASNPARAVRVRAPAQSKAPPRASAATTTISLFGDSLAQQARAAFVAQLARRSRTTSTIGTFPMTALCDFLPAITAELVQHRPGVLVLEFSGNSGSACLRDGAGTLPTIGSTGWLTHYLDDLRNVLATARTTDTTVIWATAPPVSPSQFSSNYPRTLAAAIRKLAATNDQLRVADTGAALTTDARTFSHTLPCRPDEVAFCHNGRLVVRADDGLHFDCQGIPDRLGACFGYSAGARRFGEAIADAAAAAVR